MKAREETKGAKRRVNAMTKTTKENMKVVEEEKQEGEELERPCFGPKQRSANQVSKNYEQIQRELLEKMQRVKQKVTEPTKPSKKRDKDDVTPKKSGKETINPKTDEICDSDSSDDDGKEVAKSSLEEKMLEYKQRKFAVSHSISDEEDDDEEDYSQYRRVKKERKPRKRKDRDNDRGRDKDRDRDRHKHKDKHRDKHRRDKDKRDKDKRKDMKVSDGPREPKKKKVIIHRPRPGHKPMSFEELLAMAAKKKVEPIANPSSKKPETAKKKRPGDDRPMTQEEKDRVARRSTKEYQDWLKFGKPTGGGQSQKSEDPRKERTAGGPKERGEREQSSKKEYSSPLKPPVHPTDKPVGARYNTTNNNVLVCGPSSGGKSVANGSKGAPPASRKGAPPMSGRGVPSGRPAQPPEKAQNPWDRIYGNIQKNRPKPPPGKCLQYVVQVLL